MFRTARRSVEHADLRSDLQAPAMPQGDVRPLEIPYAIRWLVPKGERFANFDILNDTATQLDYYRRFGHLYAVGVPTKKWRLVVVSDPVLLDEVAGNEDQFGKPVEEINFFDQLQNSRGDGISVIGDGERYDRIRRLMLPWYSPQSQRKQLPVMKEQAQALVARWAELPDDEPLDVRSWLERYSLEVSGRGACRYDFGLLQQGACPHAFAQAVPQSTRESIARVAEPRPDLALSPGAWKKRRSYREQNRELVRTADAVVRARMHTVPLGEQTDLLSHLVSTPDPETGELLDVETIRDQMLMHLSNGFNGPSITGAWLVFLLATHPDVEEKLIAEIDSVTGGDSEYDLQPDDLMALTYTTQVIKETLRIYPPMPVTIRRSLKEGLLGRYRMRKGDIVLVGALAAQRDPRYWGPRAADFDPEQFSLEKVANRPRHAFIPFSIGKRQCMAQEVTFMMLRVVLFEIYKRYRLRLAPGATVAKNTVVTTKPVSVPVVRLPRESGRRATVAERSRTSGPAVAVTRDWGEPMEIPKTSTYRGLVVAYGSNFGACKELAERFADRSRFYGYTNEVMTLNELAESPLHTEPWLLVVMTSTYTSNPPSNATAFKSMLQRAEPGAETWRNCKYAVWGLGNSQWNAFLAFPRYVDTRLSELGAEPVAGFGYGDVGSPVWERLHADWNDNLWPVLLELSGAMKTAAAASRLAAEKAAAEKLSDADSNTAMAMSLGGGTDTAPRILLVPKILTNAVGVETFEVRARACRELQAGASPKRTRQIELGLPAGIAYTAGDHLGVCPKNDEDDVERLARRLGAALEGLFMVPKTLNVGALPKGVVLQVRNVLTNIVDISGRPTIPMIQLLMEKAATPAERARLDDIRCILETPDAPESSLRRAIDAGAYDVQQLLDEFPSCKLNIFEFLQVAQPLRPRYYSPSSSPRVHGDVVHLTVGCEDVPVPDMPGRVFRGMSSRYLHALHEGDRVNVFLEGAGGFHLQDDMTKPMIFVSAGTGFAPMRAFLWERLALKRDGATLAEAALFNGIRARSLDHIYREEIEMFVAEGVLDHVHLAASREWSDRRDYVQDRLREQRALVWRLLQDGGYVYVCGSQPMRDGVRDAFVEIVGEYGAMPREHAEAFLEELEVTEERYRPDLWG